MNKLKIDRRAVACALAYGLKMPYIAVPAGFGLIFQGLIADNLTMNGLNISKSQICHYTWILALAMTVGLIISIFVSYRKPRIYVDVDITDGDDETSLEFGKKHYITLFAAIMTLLVQLLTNSLPLGALVGSGIIFGTKAIDHDKMDKLINEGIGMMGYVAFVMLVAAGFAMVLKTTGSVDSLLNSLPQFMSGNKFFAALSMLIIGLFVTMGIGTSFGTIPILAVLYVPVCVKLGFSLPATVIIIAAAAALGDAGSPASDTTLGPTAGLDADGQHNHIWDTCVPTFLHYNLALILFAIIAVAVF